MVNPVARWSDICVVAPWKRAASKDRPWPDWRGAYLAFFRLGLIWNRLEHAIQSTDHARRRTVCAFLRYALSDVTALADVAFKRAERARVLHRQMLAALPEGLPWGLAAFGWKR